MVLLTGPLVVAFWGMMDHPSRGHGIQVQVTQDLLGQIMACPVSMRMISLASGIRYTVEDLCV